MLSSKQAFSVALWSLLSACLHVELHGPAAPAAFLAKGVKGRGEVAGLSHFSSAVMGWLVPGQGACEELVPHASRCQRWLRCSLGSPAEHDGLPGVPQSAQHLNGELRPAFTIVSWSADSFLNHQTAKSRKG